LKSIRSDDMVIEFTSPYAIYHITTFYSCDFDYRPWFKKFFLISMKIKLHNVRIFNKYSIFILTAYTILLNVKCLPSNYISKRIRRNIMSFFVVILCYGRLTPLTFNNIISNIVVPNFCCWSHRTSCHAVLVIGLYELLGNPTT
jgi:hypothetical protein